MTFERISDLTLGCLIGGAAGDALGYAVEFNPYRRILAVYGDKGIQNYQLDPPTGKAVFSDDTQMTLFTAEGIIHAVETGQDALLSIRDAYLAWLATQGRRAPVPQWSRLAERPSLNVCRAPGNTCMDSLSTHAAGYEPHNLSKGCGAVMRVAPLAIAGINNMCLRANERLDLAVESSKLTHLHPLGYMPSYVLVGLIYNIVVNGGMPAEGPERMRDIFALCCMRHARSLQSRFEKDAAHAAMLENLIETAVLLARNNAPDIDNISLLGEGWVAEETLAIAIYCTLRHIDDFSAALCASVNHDGDSDSTGAVCGNIMGAIHGLNAIPEKWTADLQDTDLLLRIGRQLTELKN